MPFYFYILWYTYLRIVKVYIVTTRSPNLDWVCWTLVDNLLSPIFCFVEAFVQFSSVAQSCPTLCNPMDFSMPGFPVHYQLPELTQTHVHLSRWCHPTISSSVFPFSSRLQSFPASESFPMSQFLRLRKCFSLLRLLTVFFINQCEILSNVFLHLLNIIWFYPLYG